MPIKAQHTFIGMDRDTDDRFMKEGSYRYGLNIHIGSSEGSNVLSVENVKGNSLVSYSLPTGTNQIIGAHEDIINKCVYYFLANYSTIDIFSTSGSTVTTSSAHGLVLSDLVNISGISGRTNILGKWIVKPIDSTSFDVLNPLTYITPSLQSIVLTGTSGASGTITKYKHSILKYDAVSNTITLIYQHSRLNFDAANIVSGTALINGVLHWTDGSNPPRSLILSTVSTYGTFFVEPMLDFIRIPPTKPATLVGRWVNSNGVDVSYSSNKTEPNSMNDKTYQFIYRYVYYDDSKSVWSPLTVSMPTGFVSSRVNRIDMTISNAETNNYLYFSKVIKSIEIGFRDSTLLSFKYAVRVPFPTSTGTVSYSFYNNVAYSVISTNETTKYSDAVPLVAGALSAVDNRVFQGDCTEGFDVDPSTFSASNITYSLPPSGNTITWKMFSDFDIGIVFADRADRRSGVYNLIKAHGTLNKKTIPSFTLTGQPPEWATHYQIVRSNNLTKNWFIQGFIKYYKSSGGTTQIVFNGQNGGVYYAPSVGDYVMRVNPILDPDATFFNPPKYKVIGAGVTDIGEATIILDGFAEDLVTAIAVEIFTPNTIKDQLYYEIGYMQEIKDPGTSARSFFSNGATAGTVDLASLLSGDAYQRRLNDATAYHAHTTVSITQSALLNPIVAITINNEQFSISSPYDNIQDVATRIVAEINESQYYRAEIVYTRINIIKFYLYDIRQGNLSPGINITTIIGMTEDPGNYSYVQAQNAIILYQFEAMSANDDDLTWERNIGRPNIVLQDGDREERRSSLIRFGGKFLADTTINLINSYSFDDQEPLPGNGGITKLIAAANNQAEGTILLAVQQNDICSLYIGQTVIKNSGGEQNVAVTDKVIGTVNPLQKLVGTVNPESVVQNNGLVYGFDALRGIVWRYGQDGLNFISDIGMKNFFYLRSQYLISLGTYKCYAGIDPFHNEYILTIPNTDSSLKTVAWSENLNRWSSFMSYVGEWYQKINTQMVSFLNGALWLHGSNSVYVNFYGTQYKPQLEMVCNQDPDITKILQIVEQISTTHWDCIDIATPQGQSSELLGLFDLSTPNSYPQDFHQYDNTTFVGNVLRDKNTPAMQSSDYPLLNGDVIRSETFTVLMENNETTKQNLYFVNLMYAPSFKKA